jgi:hypothetical protein
LLSAVLVPACWFASLGVSFREHAPFFLRDYVPFLWSIYACTVDLLVSSFVFFFLFLIYKFLTFDKKKRALSVCS